MWIYIIQDINVNHLPFTLVIISLVFLIIDIIFFFLMVNNENGEFINTISQKCQNSMYGETISDYNIYYTKTIFVHIYKSCE